MEAQNADQKLDVLSDELLVRLLATYNKKFHDECVLIFNQSPPGTYTEFGLISATRNSICKSEFSHDAHMDLVHCNS